MVIALSGAALAQVAPSSRFFLTIQGISGESTADGHTGDIDVFSVKLGVNQRGITDFGGGAGVGKSTFLPIVVFKNVDTSSPALFLACASGKHIPQAKLTAIKAGANQPYLTITLTDVLVSSLNNESADTDGVTTVLESLSLNFSKIEFSYRPPGAQGGLGQAVTSGFDLKANKKL